MTTARVSLDGRVALIPIDPDNVAAIKELIQGANFSARGLSVSLYTPVGLLPQLLISGDPEKVKPFVDVINELFLNTGHKHMVIISARLRELTDSDLRNLGINVMATSISYDALYMVPGGWQANFGINQGTSNNILQLDESTGTGRILVASEVFTPNGVKAQISDIQHVPVFTVDSNKNAQTQYQDLETSIQVTPTVMDLPKGDPASSTVRLDIGVKVSIISGESRSGSVTAPQYSEKKFETTRVFPADGQTYIVGTFVSDSLIKSRSGVPFLSSIPLIKYLFSQETTNKQRTFAVLSLSVRVIPAGSRTDTLTKPWFQAPGPASPSTSPSTHRSVPEPSVPEWTLDQPMSPAPPSSPPKVP